MAKLRNLPLTQIALLGVVACAPTQSSHSSATLEQCCPAPGLVAGYTMFVDPTGRLIDIGPNQLHGTTLRDRRTRGPEGDDDARSFTTVDDRVDLPESDLFDLDGPFTIAARVRVDSVGLHQHIVACDDKWALWVTPNDQYRLGDTRGGGWSSEEGRVEPGVWATVVAVMTGSVGDALVPENVALWVDGERAGMSHLRSEAAQATGTWNAGELYPDDACSLGFESHQGNDAHQEMPFVGAMAEVLIYDRAWTREEVERYSR